MRQDPRPAAPSAAAVALALARGAALGATVAALLLPSGVASGRAGLGTPGTSTAPTRQRADFAGVHPSAEVQALADWIARVDDNRGAAVLVVDKKLARLYVFDARVHLLATSPVLLGAAVGDATVPGIGQRPIEQVLPEERTTPAGRFVAERGHNARGEDVVWVDYDAAVSMHRVITTVRAERRLERLASPTPADNRISYGCINVPAAFYEAWVRPPFAAGPGIVYVLPDRATIQQVFGL